MAAQCLPATVEILNRNVHWCSTARQNGLQDLTFRQSVNVSVRFEGSCFVLEDQVNFPSRIVTERVHLTLETKGNTILRNVGKHPTAYSQTEDENPQLLCWVKQEC
jgi:hypothetical protein